MGSLRPQGILTDRFFDETTDAAARPVSCEVALNQTFRSVRVDTTVRTGSFSFGIEEVWHL